MDVIYEREPHKADDIFWVTIVSSLKINPQLDRSSDNAKKIKIDPLIIGFGNLNRHIER